MTIIPAGHVPEGRARDASNDVMLCGLKVPETRPEERRRQAADAQDALLQALGHAGGRHLLDEVLSGLDKDGI